MRGQEFDERGSFDFVDLDIQIGRGKAQHCVANAAADEPRAAPRSANRRAERVERAASRSILDAKLELFWNETRHHLGIIDPVGGSCLLAGDLLANSISSPVRRRASRGILGPLAHPLYEFLRRDSMGIHTLGGLFFLPSALVLSITAGPMTQPPSVSVVSVALGVVIEVVGASEKVRSTF